MKTQILTLLATAATCMFTQAEIIRQWDFNSLESDSDRTTGTLRPNNGSGAPARSSGGVASRFGFVSSATQPEDPSSSDNSHWRLGTIDGAGGFPAQGTANKTAGAEFPVNTSGYGNIQLHWNQENSATASRYWRVQYTINGIDWLDTPNVVTASSIDINGLESGTPIWQWGLSADLSGVAGVNNNPDFGFRIVSEFESTATGSGGDVYIGNRPTASYGVNGTMWLDMVTVTGDDIDPGNQPPQISAIDDQTTLMGVATAALPFTISDAETPAGSLILSAHSSNPALVNSFTFGGSGTDRTLVATPAAGQVGSAVITVRVMDQGGKVADSSFTLSVIVPTISPIVGQWTTWDVPVTVSFTVNDLPGDPSSWVLTGSSSEPTVVPNSGITFGGSGTERTVTITGASQAYGDAVVTITVTSGSWQASTDFAVRLLPPFIVEYDLTNVPNTVAAVAPATSVAPGLQAANLSRGPGPAANGMVGVYNANRWNNPTSAYQPSNPSRAAALTRGDYFQFDVSVDAGTVVSLATLDTSLRRSALNAALNFEWQYSFDGFATPGVTIPPTGPIWDMLNWTQSHFTYLGRSATATPPVGSPDNYAYMLTRVDNQGDGNPMPAIDLSVIPGLQNVEGPVTVTFRLYAWGNNSTVDSNQAGLGRYDGPRIRGMFAMPLADLVLPSGDLIYAVGQAAVGIDGRATIIDPFSFQYGGTILTVSLTANGTADDRLEVRHTGSGAGQVGVSGNTISYGGTAIGTFTGGSGTTPLVITLNSASTPASAEAVLRNVTFRNVSSSPSLNRRTVSYVLERGDGFTVSATTGIRLGALRYSDFQEGADHGFGTYTGTFDIELWENQPDTPFPTGHGVDRLWIDARTAGTTEEAQVLLRFENIIGAGPGQIPPGSTIVSADLILNVNDSGDGSPLFRMLQPWDAENATWNSMVNGITPDGTQARASYDSQLGVALVAGASGVGSIPIGVTADVQAWVNGEPNYGWGMTSWDPDIDPSWGRGTDGLAFNPSEASNPGDRPRLRVLWVPADMPVASFRQDVNGYTGTRDTRILQSAPDEEAGTLDTLFVDWTGPGPLDGVQALIRFSDIIGVNPGQIPPGARIEAAMLDLATVANNGYGDGGQFHAMYQPWEDTATWNSLGGSGILPDGTIAALNPTVVAGSPTLNPNVCGGFMSFNVTPDVQNWANAIRPNYGWGIVPWPNGSDGWAIATSEATIERERPRLRVFYTPGAPLVILQPPVVSPGSVEIRFSGEVGETYTVLRAASVTGPYTSIGTAVVQAGGTATLVDNSPLSGGAFYRVSKP
jgi:hypothetical protein